MTNRRDALRTFAVGAVAVSAHAQTSHQNHEPEKEVVAAIQPPATAFFSADERKIVARLVDLIIPRTDTPGASDAGVHLLMDQWVLQSPERGAEMREGLGHLPTDFLSMSEDRQIALLQKMNDEKSPFFRSIRRATIELYYSTPQGLQQELGWHGNTFLQSFPGCTHPEHKV